MRTQGTSGINETHIHPIDVTSCYTQPTTSPEIDARVVDVTKEYRFGAKMGQRWNSAGLALQKLRA